VAPHGRGHAAAREHAAHLVSGRVRVRVRVQPTW
jgi:hypothetical protein